MKTVTHWMHFRVEMSFVEHNGIVVSFYETMDEATRAVNKSGCFHHSITPCNFPTYEKVFNA